MINIDLTGKTFGRLKVICKSDKVGRFKEIKYDCICNCGNKKTVLASLLRKGDCNSCGCLQKEKLISRSTKNKGESACLSTYYRYKVAAKSRGFIFNLTKEEFKNLVLQNCKYCGSKPSSVCKSRNSNGGDFIYNGIDRVDNNIGYLLENCVTCCGICNIMKRHHSLDTFKEHIIKIYNNIKNDISN